jgi:hypothetical protein
VDEFWHTHILQTMKYADDCQAVFGTFLHHNPHIGKLTQADLDKRVEYAEKTRQFYEREFGTEAAGTAWAGDVIGEDNAAVSSILIRSESAAVSSILIRPESAAVSSILIRAENAAVSSILIRAENAAVSSILIRPDNAAVSSIVIRPEKGATAPVQT